MNASTMQDKADADAALDAALTQLNVVVEAYPELKSDTTYIGLMDELAGSEKMCIRDRSNSLFHWLWSAVWYLLAGS